MSYTQFGYTAFPPTSQLMVGGTGVGSSSASSACCGGDSGRVSVGADGQTASAVCSLPATYDSRLLSTYPRLYPTPYADQPYPNFESSAFYPSLSSAYGMKDANDPWRGITPSASYYYDPSLAAYGYGGLDFNGARRKNVTRDSTSTLKAWLNEHRKNPYPTKGEKIMLAIITKMTLTQVSTWFANARRRLKKENKMTWEPRNKMDADDAKDFDEDEEDDKAEREVNKNCAGDGSNSGISERGNAESQDDGSDLRPALERCDSTEESEDGVRAMGCGDNSIDGVVRYSSGDENLESSNYHILRHANSVSNNLSRRLTSSLKDRDNVPLLPAADFTPADSSSPSNLRDMQNFIRSPGDIAQNKNMTPSVNNSSSCNSNVDSEHPLSENNSKPKIWSLADTATSKTPPSAGQNLPEIIPDGSNAVVDMLGHCGWFSVNPYQVNGPSSTMATFAGYPHGPAFVSTAGNAGGMFGSSSSNASGTSAGIGFSPIPPQTDTPPQTPPNMKVSTTLPLCSTSYLGGQSAHLYVGQGQTAGMRPGGSVPASMQVKSGGVYAVGGRSANNRPYRPDLMPEDYPTGHFRSPPIQ